MSFIIIFMLKIIDLTSVIICFNWNWLCFNQWSHWPQVDLCSHLNWVLCALVYRFCSMFLYGFSFTMGLIYQAHNGGRFVEIYFGLGPLFPIYVFTRILLVLKELESWESQSRLLCSKWEIKRGRTKCNPISCFKHLQSN